MGKQLIVGLRERGGKVIAGPEMGTDRITLQKVIQRNVEQGATVYTDEASGYSKLSQLGYEHGTVNHSSQGIREWHGLHKRHRERLGLVEAWIQWCISPLEQQALPALCQRVLLPLERRELPD